MKLPTKTRIQSLLFCRAFFTVPQARAWAKKHGFTSRDVDVTENQIHLRQGDPRLFQPGSFRTIKLDPKRNLQAVIGRPWVALDRDGSNPHPKPDNDAKELFKTIHYEWALHRRKHILYASLAKAKGSGKYDGKAARRRFKPLVIAAAKLYRRKHKIKPRLAEVFPARTVEQTIDKLMREFLTYWNKGQLDQHIPRKGWQRRKEPKI